MARKANPVLVGAFVVGAIALTLGALVLWGGTGLFRTKLDYVLYFDSNVTGLSKGASVEFRGVRIGQVTDIELRWGTPIVAVFIALEPETFRDAPTGDVSATIENAVQALGLRAQLRTQSLLTGVLYVALDLFPGTPITLRAPASSTVPELPTVPTDIEVWTAKLERLADAIQKIPLEEMAKSTAETLEVVRNLVGSPEAARAVKSAEALLNDARGLMHKLDRQAGPLLAKAQSTLGEVDAALAEARALAQRLDASTATLTTEADSTLRTAREALADLPPLVEDARQLLAKVDAQADPLLGSLRSTSEAARATMERAQLTLGGVDRTLDQESPLGYELLQMLKELRQAAVALRSLADYLERVPDAPLYGVRRPRQGAR